MSATDVRPFPMQVIEPAPYIAAMTHITSYAEIDEVLRSKDFVQGSHQESKPFFGDCLLLVDGVDHFRRRRLEAPLFAKDNLFSYERQVLQPAIERCLDLCRADRDAEGRARGDLVLLTRRMLLQMTAQIAGIDGVDAEASTDRFGYFLDKLSEGVGVEWSTRDHCEVIREVLEIRHAFVEEFYAPSIHHREQLVARWRDGDLDRDGLPMDLATILMTAHDPGWDLELPLREMTLYLVAGTQTTTHALPHVVNHLTGWLLQQPADAALLQDQEFLQAAAYESLRMHLPSPSLLRIAATDVTLSTGRRVVAGERVALLFTPANRDPAAFGADAEVFDPHRVVQPPVKPWGLAFGGGIHTCIGRQLVTGLSRLVDDVDERSRTTDGIEVQILAALYAAGVEMDPERPPRYRAASHHDAFDSFPVRFRNL